MKRDEVLDSAKELINGQRAKDYGDARENFTVIAQRWSTTFGIEVTPEQVGLCLLDLKIARLISSPGHEDSWKDAAGYVALSAELATEEGESVEEKWPKPSSGVALGRCASALATGSGIAACQRPSGHAGQHCVRNGNSYTSW